MTQLNEPNTEITTKTKTKRSPLILILFMVLGIFIALAGVVAFEIIAKTQVVAFLPQANPPDSEYREYPTNTELAANSAIGERVRVIENSKTGQHEETFPVLPGGDCYSKIILQFDPTGPVVPQVGHHVFFGKVKERKLLPVIQGCLFYTYDLTIMVEQVR